MEGSCAGRHLGEEFFLGLLCGVNRRDALPEFSLLAPDGSNSRPNAGVRSRRGHLRKSFRVEGPRFEERFRLVESRLDRRGKPACDFERFHAIEGLKLRPSAGKSQEGESEDRKAFDGHPTSAEKES